MCFTVAYINECIGSTLSTGIGAKPFDDWRRYCQLDCKAHRAPYDKYAFENTPHEIEKQYGLDCAENYLNFRPENYLGEACRMKMI